MCKCFSSLWLICIIISLESVSWLALCFCHNTHMLLQKVLYLLLPPLTRLLPLVIKEQHPAHLQPINELLSTDRPGQAAFTQLTAEKMWIYNPATTKITATINYFYYICCSCNYWWGPWGKYKLLSSLLYVQNVQFPHVWILSDPTFAGGFIKTKWTQECLTCKAKCDAVILQCW